MITIGIHAKLQHSGVVGMLRNIFYKSGVRINIVETFNFYTEMDAKTSLIAYLKELRKSKTDIVIIKIIPEKMMQGLYNHVRFNFLIYEHAIEQYPKYFTQTYLSYYKKILSNMEKEDIALINIDNDKMAELLKGSKMCVITYGLNSKATITTSSIEEGEQPNTFIYCLQRSIKTINGEDIEAQEFPVRVRSSKDKEIYNTLGAVTIGLIYNVDIFQIQAFIL